MLFVPPFFEDILMSIFREGCIGGSIADCQLFEKFGGELEVDSMCNI